MVRSLILMSVQGFTPTFKQLIEIGKAKAALSELEKNGLMAFVKHLTKAKSSEIVLSEGKVEVYGKNSAHHVYCYHNTGIMRLTPSVSMSTETKKKFYPFN